MGVKNSSKKCLNYQNISTKRNTSSLQCYRKSFSLARRQRKFLGSRPWRTQQRKRRERSSLEQETKICLFSDAINFFGDGNEKTPTLADEKYRRCHQLLEERADEKAPSSSKSSKGIENKSLDTKPPKSIHAIQTDGGDNGIGAPGWS